MIQRYQLQTKAVPQDISFSLPLCLPLLWLTAFSGIFCAFQTFFYFHPSNLANAQFLTGIQYIQVLSDPSLLQSNSFEISESLPIQPAIYNGRDMEEMPLYDSHLCHTLVYFVTCTQFTTIGAQKANCANVIAPSLSRP